MSKKMWAYMMGLGNNMWGDRPEDGFEEELTTDDDVWKQVAQFLPGQGFNTVLVDVGDGILYETHPEISVRGAWTKDKLKKELDYLRSLGLTPLPKLNFSACHDAWLKDYSRMLSTPQYYRVCEDVIKEVAEAFGYPKYFHLGMDEETAPNQVGLDYCCIRQHDLWWHDAYFLFDVCEKVGARPWIWSDYCWENRDVFLAKMPKSVLQSNWSYNTVRKNPDGSYKSVGYQTYCILEEAGYDQVPTSSTWQHWYNTKETMQISREHISPERLVGHMTAPWMPTKPFALYELLDDALQFGNAKKEMYPED